MLSSDLNVIIVDRETSRNVKLVYDGVKFVKELISGITIIVMIMKLLKGFSDLVLGGLIMEKVLQFSVNETGPVNNTVNEVVRDVRGVKLINGVDETLKLKNGFGGERFVVERQVDKSVSDGGI